MRKPLQYLGLFVLLSCSAVSAQEPSPPLELQSSDIRLRDIAQVPDEFPQLGDQIVARIPAHARQFRLDATTVSNILRRIAPRMKLAAKTEGAMDFVLAGDQPQLGRVCSALNTPIVMGEYVSASQLAPIACEENRASNAGIRFDRRARALRATEDLPTGAYLGRVIVTPAQITPANTDLLLRVSAGPVVIEREVRTMQPSRSGERVFVQTAEGSVLSVILEENPS